MVRDQKGQALTEFALVLPLLLLLIAGIIDFGRISYAYMNLHLTTQEAVRLGGSGKGDTEIIQFVKNHFTAENADSMEISISPAQSQRKSGDYVTVTLEYPIEYVTPFLSQILPSPFMVSTDSTIRIE